MLVRAHSATDSASLQRLVRVCLRQFYEVPSVLRTASSYIRTSAIWRGTLAEEPLASFYSRINAKYCSKFKSRANAPVAAELAAAEQTEQKPRSK